MSVQKESPKLQTQPPSVAVIAAFILVSRVRLVLRFICVILRAASSVSVRRGGPSAQHRALHLSLQPFVHRNDLYIYPCQAVKRPKSSKLDLQLQLCNTGRLELTFFGARVMTTSYRGIEPALLVSSL